MHVNERRRIHLGSLPVCAAFTLTGFRVRRVLRSKWHLESPLRTRESLQRSAVPFHPDHGRTAALAEAKDKTIQVPVISAR